MYKFRVKDTGPDIALLSTRALLAISAVAALVYRSERYSIFNIIGAILLTTAALFAGRIVSKIPKIILFLTAAIVLFFTTGSFWFAVILVVHGSLLKLLHKTPEIEIGENGIRIHKLLSSATAEPWSSFGNIVLKDNLLTLDYTSDKIIQVELEEPVTINETEFNAFCAASIQV